MMEKGSARESFWDQFGDHFRAKIDEKIDAKIDAEKVMKNDENRYENEVIFGSKFFENFIVCEKLLMQENL